MPERDWWRRFLERALPWIDPQAYDRERAVSRRVLERAERVISETHRVERVIRASR